MPTAFAGGFIFNGFFLSVGIVTTAAERFGEAGLARAMGVLLCLMGGVLICFGMGAANRELAKPESDVEWLLTMPVPLSVVHAMRIAERTFTSFLAWFSVFPFLTVLAWRSGLRWSAPIVGLLLAFPYFTVIAGAQVLLEALIRAYLPRGVIRNAQAVFTIMGVAGVFLVLTVARSAEEDGHFLWSWLQAGMAFPWLPLARPALVAACSGASQCTYLFDLLVYLAECALYFAACWAALQRIPLQGVRSDAGGLLGVRFGNLGKSALHAPPRPVSRRWLRGVVGKELRLLARDRTLLVNTLILPGLIVGLQVAFNPRVLAGLSEDPVHVSALAFAFGSYMLVMSSTNLVNSEGASLWLLYTVPQRLDRMLLQKALMWTPFAGFYFGVVLIYGVSRQGVSASLGLSAAYALLGLPVYATIGGALGVLGFDPTRRDARKRLRADYVYLFMLLQGFYAYGFYAPSQWAKVPLFIILFSLALALWQNVSRKLPYLLDPSSLPPPSVSLADGLVAALAFFILQGVCLVALSQSSLERWSATFFSFAASAGVVCCATFVVLWRRRVPDLLRALGFTVGEGWIRTLSTTVLCSAPAVAVGVTYTWLSRSWGWLRQLFEQQTAILSPLESDSTVWLVLLAVVAAPICEEVIFRGMIYRGLRKTFSFPVSTLASAGLFAAVHPALSVPPVLVMAFCASVALERSRSLWSSMLVHASYNATVLWAAGVL